MRQKRSKMELSITKKYVVVEFVAEKSIQAIPAKWLTSDIKEAWWPTHAKNFKLLKLISICADVDCSTWEKFAVRIHAQSGK